MTSADKTAARDGLLFSAPFLAVYALFLVFPMAFGLYISFFQWDILSDKVWVGLGNYVAMFTDKDFLAALWHTVYFVIVSTPVLLVVGFAMALFVTSRSPLKNAGETLFFMPYILSITVIGALWAWMMQKNYGLFNRLIVMLGGHKIDWLTEPNLAMLSIVGATLWWTAGFNMLLFSAGIKQISREMYEAAEIDGAGYWTTVFRLTLPMLKPTTVLCLILQVIASFNIFGQVYVMTSGGPYGTTRVLTQYIYETGFTYFKMGYASAMAYILFAIILIISLLQYKLVGEEEA
jgi:multiple sugar transport system permease protein